MNAVANLKCLLRLSNVTIGGKNKLNALLRYIIIYL